MTKEEFEKLTPKQQSIEVAKALAWICVQEVMNPFLVSCEELDCIKVVLGKYRE